MPTQAKTSVSRPQTDPMDEALEQHMGALGLSERNRLFLRRLHLAEKQLNEAFEVAHQGGNLQSKISRIYHELYRAG